MSCPYSHTAILSLVVASLVLLAHPVGIADEELTHPLPLAEGDDLARPLMAQVPDLAPFACAHLATSPLQFAPAL